MPPRSRELVIRSLLAASWPLVASSATFTRLDDERYFFGIDVQHSAFLAAVLPVITRHRVPVAMWPSCIQLGLHCAHTLPATSF